MKVILLQEVTGIGQAGEVKEVNDGYARNYLIPRGMAQLATEAAIQRAREQETVAKRRYRRDLAEAEVLAEHLNNLTLRFQAKVGEQDLLFGTITSSDIAAAIQETLDIEVDRRKIEVGDPIRRPGIYSIPIRLIGNLEPRVNVVVEREEEEQEEQEAE